MTFQVRTQICNVVEVAVAAVAATAFCTTVATTAIDTKID
jgi:hypothetical protein